MKQSSNQYWRRFALSLAIVVVGALPFLLGGDFGDFIRGPWALVGFAADKLGFSGAINPTFWSWLVGVLTVLLLGICARWKFVSGLMAGWFVLNILFGYLAWWSYSHS